MLTLARFMIVASVIVVGVLPTFDLRYSGLLGPKLVAAGELAAE